MFKYEMHLHTLESSKCGQVSAADMVDFYKRAGYDGVFITDHFFNGNCTVSKHLPWAERVDAYMTAYENAKKRGDEIGLKVFFGFELGYNGTDFLVYGLDREWLLNHPYCDRITAGEFSTLAHESDALFVQAHPFREAGYIEMIRLSPRIVDAVETLNACRTDFENHMADLYADSYGLIKTCGSDNHTGEKRVRLSALELENEALSDRDIINAIKENRHHIAIYDTQDLLK